MLVFSALKPRTIEGWFEVSIEISDSIHPLLESADLERKVHLWLGKNCAYRYAVTSRSVLFEHEDDAVAFYLKHAGKNDLVGDLVSLRGPPGPMGPQGTPGSG